MAGDIPLEELLPKANMSIYGLVRLASKRALELTDGKPSLVEKEDNEKLTTVALREIMGAKVVDGAVADKFKEQNEEQTAE